MLENHNDDNTNASDDALFAEMAAALDGKNSDDSSEKLTEDSDDKLFNELADDSALATAGAEKTEPKDAFNFDDLPPAAQQTFKDLEQYKKSNEGRVSAMQRQIDEQRNQLEQLQLSGKGNSQQAQALAESIEENEIDLGDLAQEIPELQAVVNELKTLRERVKGIDGVVQDKVIAPAHLAAEREVTARELVALEEKHPDKAQIESNPAFWNWVDSQHGAVQSLAKSNHANDVSALIDLYKQANPSAKSAKKVSRNLDDMMVIPNEGNGRSQSASGDDDALFSHYAKLADSGKL